MYISIKEEFEWVILIRKSTKNRNHIDQKKKEKRTNNDLQNIHIKDSHAKMILITNIHKRKQKQMQPTRRRTDETMTERKRTKEQTLASPYIH